MTEPSSNKNLVVGERTEGGNSQNAATAPALPELHEETLSQKLVHSVTDTFVRRLAEHAPYMKSSSPTRITFPCILSPGLATVALSNAIRSVPAGMVVLERTTLSDFRQADFLIVLRLQTEAEGIIQELIPLVSTRLNKHLAFRNDVQQIAWCVRSVKEFDWDVFFPEDEDTSPTDKLPDSHIAPVAPATPVSPAAPAELREANDTNQEAREAVEARIAVSMARYTVARRFHMTLSTLAGLRGYDSYYPELPAVSPAMLDSLSKWPAAAAVLERDQTLTDKMLKSLSDEDFDKKRAYVFHRSLGPDGPTVRSCEGILEDVGEAPGTPATDATQEEIISYIVE